MLGVTDGLGFPRTCGVLGRGDALLLYIDGVIETRTRDLRDGIDRMLGTAEQMISRGFSGMAAKMCAAAPARPTTARPSPRLATLTEAGLTEGDTTGVHRGVGTERRRSNGADRGRELRPCWVGDARARWARSAHSRAHVVGHELIFISPLKRMHPTQTPKTASRAREDHHDDADHDDAGARGLRPGRHAEHPQQGCGPGHDGADGSGEPLRRPRGGSGACSDARPEDAPDEPCHGAGVRAERRPQREEVRRQQGVKPPLLGAEGDRANEQDHGRDEPHRDVVDKAGKREMRMGCATHVGSSYRPE